MEFSGLISFGAAASASVAEAREPEKLVPPPESPPRSLLTYDDGAGGTARTTGLITRKGDLGVLRPRGILQQEDSAEIGAASDASEAATPPRGHGHGDGHAHGLACSHCSGSSAGSSAPICRGFGEHRRFLLWLALG